MAKGLGADERYWQALDQGRLELPRCASCRRWSWPAPFRCSECGAAEAEWDAVEPVGVIYSWTRTWHNFGGAEALGLPYVSVLVEVPAAGGIRLLGLFDNELPPPSIGLPVTGKVVATEAFGRSIPAWRWEPQT